MDYQNIMIVGIIGCFGEVVRAGYDGLTIDDDHLVVEGVFIPIGFDGQFRAVQIDQSALRCAAVFDDYLDLHPGFWHAQSSRQKLIRRA